MYLVLLLFSFGFKNMHYPLIISNLYIICFGHLRVCVCVGVGVVCMHVCMHLCVHVCEPEVDFGSPPQLLSTSCVEIRACQLS